MENIGKPIDIFLNDFFFFLGNILDRFRSLFGLVFGVFSAFFCNRPGFVPGFQICNRFSQIRNGFLKRSNLGLLGIDGFADGRALLDLDRRVWASGRLPLAAL